MDSMHHLPDRAVILLNAASPVNKIKHHSISLEVVAKKSITYLINDELQPLSDISVHARRLSDLTSRSERLDVRDKIFEDLRANSRAICRKLSQIWAEQPIS